MVRRALRLIIIFYFLAVRVSAQQNNIWYFGDHAGISFNKIKEGSPIPYAVTDGSMLTAEACASTCDANGNLLFYTNGQTIFNRHHMVMANGDGLAGHVSAFQGALIVPQPNSDSLFYVFTTDGFEKKFLAGYHYSVVDISQNNGDGGVITKNIALKAPGTERLTAARHANGVDVWVITNDFNSNIFRAWLVTCTGIQKQEVVSTAGEVMDRFDEMNSGGMKISPNGRMLCQTHFPSIEAPAADNFFQLFDFDNATGMLSNARTVDIASASYRSCEFSPDSKLLYAVRSTSREIDQFDVTQASLASIIASRISIASDFGIYGIQTGPDEKIYLNHRAKSLSVISKPNNRGAGCQYETDKIDLGGKNAELGLPTVINDLYFNALTDFNYTILDSCTGKVQFNAFTNISGIVNWLWLFGDGDTSSLQDPQHVFAGAGQVYPVKLKVKAVTACGYFEKNKDIFPGGIALEPGFDFLVNCDSSYVSFMNNSFVSAASAANYFWDFGDGTTSSEVDPVHNYFIPGSYNIKLAIHTGTTCLDDSLAKNVIIQKLNIQVTPDAVVDEGKSMQLNISGGGTHFEWYPSTWLNNAGIANPVTTPYEDIRYIVKVSNDAGCTAMDSVFIKVTAINDIYVPSGFSPNHDELNDILKPYMGIQFKLEYFNIYNRMGKLVFSTNNKGNGWDGTIDNAPQGNGVYVWILKARNKDGNPVTMKGTVTLIR